MIIIVMGVAGTGKTTLGKALAARLGWAFVEADDYHPPSNLEKMRNGHPLDDKDRAPWLAAVNARIRSIAAPSGHAVVACSALRRAYRERLSDGIADVHFVHLDGDPELIDRRLRARQAHFMPPELLGSQLSTLEAPGDTLSVSIAQPTRRQVDAVIAALNPPDR